MDRQAPTRDTVLVKSREMTGRSQTLPQWLGRRCKDDIGTVDGDHYVACVILNKFEKMKILKGKLQPEKVSL
jgi:hypothetical protein